MKRKLSKKRRRILKMQDRERSVGISKFDPAGRWLAENDPQQKRKR